MAGRNPWKHGGSMSKGTNKVILIGNVGRDPDIRTTEDGAKSATFSLATNRKAGADGYERADWHRVVMRDHRLSRFAEQYVETGDRLYVEGRLEYDSYERDGVTIPTAEIIAREVVLLRERGEGRTLHASADSLAEIATDLEQLAESVQQTLARLRRIA